MSLWGLHVMTLIPYTAGFPRTGKLSEHLLPLSHRTHTLIPSRGRTVNTLAGRTGKTTILGKALWI